MNIKGIELLRGFGLPAPKDETIFRDFGKVDLDRLYWKNNSGATILAFDYSEPVNQNPLLEKNVRRYGVPREKYFETLGMLMDQLLARGVDRKNMVFITHQSYFPEDIAYSGRISVCQNENGFGAVLFDGVESLRKAKADFTPGFVHQCPIIGGRIMQSRAETFVSRINLPGGLLARITRDALSIPQNPSIDFEVYANGNIFYHDMFLNKTYS